MNFVKFLRTPYLQIISGQLLLFLLIVHAETEPKTAMQAMNSRIMKRFEIKAPMKLACVKCKQAHSFLQCN